MKALSGHSSFSTYFALQRGNGVWVKEGENYSERKQNQKKKTWTLDVQMDRNWVGDVEGFRKRVFQVSRK